MACSPDGSQLPQGIWYEADRQRYRVRVYRRSRVIHRSYHGNLSDALAAFQEAKNRQKWLRQVDSRPVNTPEMQIRALADNLI